MSDEAKEMQGVGVAWMFAQNLAVKMLGFRKAARFVKSYGGR
jgi:hypothetical protein